MKRLEEILDLCKEEHSLNINNNRESAIGFLQRQLKLHQEYNLGYHRGGNGLTLYPWINLLVDKLLLRSYINGDMQITVSDGTNRNIGKSENILKPIEERAEDLVLLAPTTFGYTAEYIKNRTDMRLYHLFTRHNVRRYKPCFMKTYQNWGDLIDEIGRDKETVKYFGRVIRYKRDVSKVL